MKFPTGYRLGIVNPLTLVGNEIKTILRQRSFPFERVEIYGKHATLRTEEMDRVLVARGLTSPVECSDYWHLPWEQRCGYATEDKLFLDSIEQSKPAEVTAADGGRAVRMALAIYESARTGAPVKL